MTKNTSEDLLPDDRFERLDITYEQTPMYRRRWFICVSMLFFIPFTLILVLSGDVYLKRKGVVYRMLPTQKKFIVVACSGLILVGLFRVIIPG
ncbi:hypothetical protein [Vibrio neptunius]|uniref:hypothetical protein n=1 Tax=Vibrio neptunius TaxID=170651 RepID=UPI0019D24281|nr:hypothetical protein [Vibrio neptunius]MBN3574598.1 hypothetical protein [Vibrio neptunius]QXX05762.1 hypothetical protein KW548_11255 [Vibrio neptunius]